MKGENMKKLITFILFLIMIGLMIILGMQINNLLNQENDNIKNTSKNM